MEIIFVTTTNTVDSDINLRRSYSDYWKLVQLSGFQVINLSQIEYDNPDHTYVFAPPGDGNVKAAVSSDKAKERKCRLIGWQFEFPHKWENGVPVDNMEIPDEFDEWWTPEPYVRYLLELYNEPEKAEKLKFVFLGGHDNYGGEPEKDKLWDFCDLSYRYGAREHKMRILSEHGYTFAPLGYGIDRDSILKRSRWGLQLHQFPMPFTAPQRFTLFASYQLPIVSDFCATPSPYEIFMSPLLHFYPRESVLSDERAVKQAVEHNLDLVKTKTFRRCVEEAVL